MNIVDKVTRETKLLIDSARDSVSSNLLSALKKEEVSIPLESLDKLMTVVNLAIEQGYQKAIPTFQNAVKKHVL